MISGAHSRELIRVQLRGKGEEGKMKACGEVLLREVVGEYVLVPFGETALRLHGMICLSESGAFLWRALQEEQTVESLVDCLLEEYDTDWETARRDVEEFLEQLRRLQLLDEV